MTAPLIAAVNMTVAISESGSAFGPMSRRLQAIQDLRRSLIPRKESTHERVGENGAVLAAALHGQIDDHRQRHFARSIFVHLGFGNIKDRFEAVEFGAGDGSDNLILRLVLVVHGRLRDTDVIGDHLQ